MKITPTENLCCSEGFCRLTIQGSAYNSVLIVDRCIEKKVWVLTDLVWELALVSTYLVEFFLIIQLNTASISCGRVVGLQVE